MQIKEFFIVIKNLEIIISPHAKNHLNTRQRSLFSDDELMKIIKKKPISIEQNGKKYVVIYRESDGFFKIVFVRKNNRLEVITFIKPKSLQSKKGSKR